MKKITQEADILREGVCVELDDEVDESRQSLFWYPSVVGVPGEFKVVGGLLARQMDVSSARSRYFKYSFFKVPHVCFDILYQE